MSRGERTQATRQGRPHASGSNREDDRKARKLGELNKRLKAIYEDEGIEYGDESTDEDTIVSRFKVSHLF